MTGETRLADGPPERQPDSLLVEGVPFGPPPAGAGPRWRSTAKWLLGGLLALDLGILLFALSFANVTAEGPSKRSLQHSIAILTEVDGFLDDHFETLQQEASQRPDQAVTLPDFPVEVTFAPGEISGADLEAFRALLLSRAAERVHEDGMSILQEDRGTEVSFFSPQGALRGGMDFLRPTPHHVLTVLTIALASAAGVLALGLVATGRGYGGLMGVGLGVFAAAAPFLVIAVAVRFAFRVAADGVDEYMAHEFLWLGQELTWAPIRNGMVFTVGSAVVLIVGAALARWSDSRARA